MEHGMGSRKAVLSYSTLLAPRSPLRPSMSTAELLTPLRSPLRRLTGGQIIGTGSYVPENIVTNDALASLGCDAGWIIQRTGIRERRHAPPEQSTGDMAFEAAEKCIASA